MHVVRDLAPCVSFGIPNSLIVPSTVELTKTNNQLTNLVLTSPISGNSLPSQCTTLFWAGNQSRFSLQHFHGIPGIGKVQYFLTELQIS
jgi:hypothetical protein